MIIAPALLFFGFATLLLGLRWRVTRYARHFSYDRRRDQTFDFASTEAVIQPIDLTPEGFIWPEISGSFDTAFLEISITSNLFGQLAEPWIETRTRHLCTRQYFSRSSRGQRLVNFSGLIGEGEGATPGQRFHLHAKRLNFAPQGARLVLFRTALPERPRAVVVAPHPDDAEIAAFGFYRHADATVVTVTAGDLGGFYRPHLLPDDPAQKLLTGWLRVWDSITVPFLGGVTPDRALNLGYLDSTLAAMQASPLEPATLPELPARTVGEYRRCNASSLLGQTEVPATWTSLVADLTEIFRRQNPEVIVTPHPFIDDHPDHAFTTLAVCAALRAAGLREGKLLLYTNHPPTTNLYPVGETDGAVSPPPHFGGPLAFHTLYSHPLSVEDQQLKFLALEAMHDLRTLPELHPKSPKTALRAILALLRDQITGLDRRATSYFRRAVRPNELFFVLPFDEAEELSQSLLDALAKGKLTWHQFTG